MGVPDMGNRKASMQVASGGARVTPSDGSAGKRRVHLDAPSPGPAMVIEGSRESGQFARTPGTEVSLACVRTTGPVRPSARTTALYVGFGVPPREPSISIAHGVSVRLGPGRIVLLTGPSGSGKSSALSAIESQLSLLASNGAKIVALNVQGVEFSDECGLIDEIAPERELTDAASILTACGLGEPNLWLRPYAALSDGEKFRARFAKAISQSSAHFDARLGSPGSAVSNLGAKIVNVPSPVLLCDEFCSGLHRRAAQAIAHNLRKLATRRGLCVVLACSAGDLTEDLNPDTVVKFGPSGHCEIIEQAPCMQALPSLRRSLCIEPGGKRDYDAFAGMHYRSTDELGFVDRVFVLRDGTGGEPLGIVVYAHAALEPSLRNKATDGWFSRNPQRVNTDLRVLRRLVIHPDVRGCGLGHHLVRETMPLLGTQYVECLSAMGEFNPVFERAGMTRIGQYETPPGSQAALQALRKLDVDPQSGEFAVRIARRPIVRAVVSRAVADWYAATTAGGDKRADRQSPETLARTFRGLIGVRPVYYLWCREQTLSEPQAQARGGPPVARAPGSDLLRLLQPTPLPRGCGTDGSA